MRDYSAGTFSMKFNDGEIVRHYFADSLSKAKAYVSLGVHMTSYGYKGALNITRIGQDEYDCRFMRFCIDIDRQTLTKNKAKKWLDEWWEGLGR